MLRILFSTAFSRRYIYADTTDHRLPNQIDTASKRLTSFEDSPMDLFEEIVRMRCAGERGALATFVHTDGSIPSYESSRMLVRDDGTIAGTVGGGCVEAEAWAAAKDVIQKEQPRGN